MADLDKARVLSDMIKRGKDLIEDMSLCSAIQVPEITASHLAGILRGSITMADLWNDEEFNFLFNRIIDDLMVIFEADDDLAEPLNAAIKGAIADRFLKASMKEVGIVVPTYNFLDPDQIYIFNPREYITDFVTDYYYSSFGEKARLFLPEGAVKDLASHAFEHQASLCLGVLSQDNGVVKANLDLVQPICGLPILMSYNMRTGAFKYAIGVGDYQLPELSKEILIELLDYGHVGIGATTHATEWCWV